MAKHLAVVAATGGDIYAVIVGASGSQAGQYWNGTAFVDFVAANWDTYAVPLTEDGTSGLYRAAMPGFNEPFVVDVVYFSGSPAAITDTKVGGTRFVNSGAVGWIAEDSLTV